MPYLLSTVRPILWVALGIILVIKVTSIAGIIAKTGTFGLLHTFFAKFNGVLLFIAIFLIPVSDINILGTVLIIFCGIGAIEEVIYVACFDKLNLDTKGLVFEIIKKKYLKKSKNSNKKDELLFIFFCYYCYFYGLNKL